MKHLILIFLFICICILWHRVPRILHILKSRQSPSVMLQSVGTEDDSGGSDEDENIDATREDTRRLSPSHRIFLSHAGRQKNFVEQLYVDLSNIYPKSYVFFDKISLAKGIKFPDRIFEAAEQCDLAVVVMSKEYFTHQWPMEELAAFVQAQKQTNHTLKILPLFYKLSVEEFRDEKVQATWFVEWNKLAKKNKRIDGLKLEVWKEALKVFGPLNGCIYNHGLGKVRYRKEIVQAIGKLVHLNNLFETRSYIHGSQRLLSAICKVNLKEHCEFQLAANNLGELNERRPPCFFGMYDGVGGMGKTTMTKLLCNNVCQEFLGKVCHVEFESDKTVNLQRNVLKMLTCWNEEEVAQVSILEQGYRLLKEHMPRHRVFLVLDNVCDDMSCLEEMRFYLKLQYHLGSVVCITSRSLEIFKKLHNIERAIHCFPIPTLLKGEATNLLKESVEESVEHTLSMPQKDLVTRFVQYCHLGYNNNKREYHPLALKVLGGYIGGHPPSDWPPEVDMKSLRCFEKKESPLFSIMKIGYEGLSEEMQTMYIDIVNYSTKGVFYKMQDRFCKWYSLTFNLNFPRIMGNLGFMQRRALLNIENDSIRIHDLYYEFVDKLIAQYKSSHKLEKCVLHNIVEGNCMYYKGRFNLHTSSIATLNLPKRFWFETEILHLNDCYELAKLDLRDMVNLHNLKITACRNLKNVCLDGLQHLAWLFWDTCCVEFPSMKGVTSLKCLKLFGTLSQSSKSSDLSIVKQPNYTDLHACINLKELLLESFWHMLEIPRLDQFRHLEKLHVRFCPKVQRLFGSHKLSLLKELHILRVPLKCLPNLRHFHNLVSLRLEDTKITDVKGLDGLTTLKKVYLSRCSNISHIPDLAKLSKLTKLDFQFTPVKDIRGLECLLELEELQVFSGSKLEYLPDLRSLTRLRVLNISNTLVSNLGEVGVHGLIALTILNVSKCVRVTVLPNLSKLLSLKQLNLRCAPIKEIPGIQHLSELEDLECSKSGLEFLPDLSSLKKLRKLNISKTPVSNLDASGLDNLTSLTSLSVHRCCNVTSLPSLEKLTHLKQLDVRSTPIKSIIGVGHLLELEHLWLSDSKVEVIPRVISLKRLKTLYMSQTPVSNVSRMGLDGLKALATFRLCGCYQVTYIPNLKKLSNVTHLDIKSTSIKDIQGVECLLGLEDLVCDDSKLEFLPNLSPLTRLRKLNISGTLVSNLQEAGLDRLIALAELNVSRCSKVKSIPNLRKLFSLRKLYFESTTIKCIAGVEHLRELVELWCSRSMLEFLPKLSALEKLRRLFLSETPISNLDEVGVLAALEELTACSCPNVVKLPDLQASIAIKSVNVVHSHGLMPSTFSDHEKELVKQGKLKYCDNSCPECIYRNNDKT